MKYDHVTKELIYLGTKIFYQAIDHQDNRQEILTMNGVELMSEIIKFILHNSFKTTKMEDALKITKDTNEMDVI